MAQCKTTDTANTNTTLWPTLKVQSRREARVVCFLQIPPRTHQHQSQGLSNIPEGTQNNLYNFNAGPMLTVSNPRTVSDHKMFSSPWVTDPAKGDHNSIPPKNPSSLFSNQHCKSLMFMLCIPFLYNVSVHNSFFLILIYPVYVVYFFLTLCTFTTAFLLILIYPVYSVLSKLWGK